MHIPIPRRPLPAEHLERAEALPMPPPPDDVQDGELYLPAGRP